MSQLADKLNDQAGAQCLMDAKNKADYQNRVKFYYARLLLMLRGLNTGKLEVLYYTSLPMFYACLDKIKKRKLRKSFDNAYNNIEALFIMKVKGLADDWVQLRAQTTPNR